MKKSYRFKKYKEDNLLAETDFEIVEQAAKIKELEQTLEVFSK